MAGKISRPRKVKSGHSFCRNAEAPCYVTPSTMTESPQTIVRLMASIAMEESASAINTPRNIEMKCMRTATGPLEGSGR